MQALAQRCRDAGISFTQGQVNKLVIEDKDVIGAETKDGRVVRASRRVVLAAGSWSPAIFPELSDKLTATGQVLATIQLDASEASKWKNIPVYIDMETGFYMFPPTDDNQIKIAFHLRGYTNDQPSLSDEEKNVSVPRTGHFVGQLDENIPKRSVEQLREALRRVWPQLAEKPFSGTRMCWYCDSKDCDFLVGYSAKYPSLFLATGDSGHAYKFLPVIGESASSRVSAGILLTLLVIGDLCVQSMNGNLPSHIAEAWSPQRERKDHQPDRGTSVHTPLDITELASTADLQAVQA